MGTTTFSAKCRCTKALREQPPFFPQPFMLYMPESAYLQVWPAMPQAHQVLQHMWICTGVGCWISPLTSSPTFKELGVTQTSRRVHQMLPGAELARHQLGSPAWRCSRPQLCPLQLAFLLGWMGRWKHQVLLPVFSQPLQARQGLSPRHLPVARPASWLISSFRCCSTASSSLRGAELHALSNGREKITRT